MRIEDRRRGRKKKTVKTQELETESVTNSDLEPQGDL